jgi:hypothetical protein
MYGKNYQTIYNFKALDGRQLYTVIQDEEVKFLVVNIYCPNDHKQSINFLEVVYSKILEITNDIPDCHVVLGGDFNSCMTKDDLLNRKMSKAEEELTNSIRLNNNICNLIDSYLLVNSQPAFTWNRGTCYSRLDYIYVSSNLSNKIVSSEVDWAFEKSDHAAVMTKVNIQMEIQKGPGIVKVNTEILSDDLKKGQIGEELDFLIKQIPKHWNGHTKLEYVKMSIRSVFAKYVSISRSEDKLELEKLETSLNDIEKLKQKVVKYLSNIIDESEKQTRLEIVENARITIKNNLEAIRQKIASRTEFRSAAKWYEYGEKSNKFFFSQSKFQSRQKLIEQISDGSKIYKGHNAVSNGIMKFYENLYRRVDCSMGQNTDEAFFRECPKLSDINKNVLEEKVSIEEMYKALKDCKNTAPGPDGIPYVVYKVYWKQVGWILKEAWDYSVETGTMPESHKESVITLLPKEGKDIRDIKNWRPITLTNCDAKIITKALAMRLNPILETIIDPSQTAYVPGRSVMDNTRSNRFIKEYCIRKNIKAAIISLDAKKAFDSVDHKYIDKVLDKYGFGNNFRKYFKTLYMDLKARILVNGYLSEAIAIERGVKQGDALSCAIFILCIDPLIRNINQNKRIKSIKIKIRGSDEINHKACGFADDISVLCQNDIESIKEIFNEYQRLTNKSGLTLNADKTEILNIACESGVYDIRYENDNISIESVDKLKICGIYYCSDKELEYKLNVHDKIDKFKINVKKWESRNLTFEGKSLILKTFGISQLIYVMQCVNIRNEQLIQIERLIFGFLWNKKNVNSDSTQNSGNNRAKDRICRSIMKNSYEKGGLNITDIECLDRSLKLKQYIRASESTHNVKRIQIYCNSNNKCTLAQEFVVNSKEDVCQTAQETLNLITDYTRNKFFGEDESVINSSLAINQIASTNIEIFLLRKKKVFLNCISGKLKDEGIATYLDLVMAAETELCRKKSKILEMILSAFPAYFRDVANSFDENINVRQDNLTHIMNAEGTWIAIRESTTKQLQWLLKHVLGKLKDLEINSKISMIDNEVVNIIQFRQQCKNAQLRNVHFRMIHNDFYTYERMFKFKMTDSPQCQRCVEMETTKHLLWECAESQKIWNLYNAILTRVQLQNMHISTYEDIYRTESMGILSIIKTKIVNEFIQIIRPRNWTIEKIENVISNIRTIELYNANKRNDWIKTNKIWKIFENY